jgi:alginate O-acetyltransferase complex protein AlgJ
LAGLLHRAARADLVGIVEVGREGWLFPHWEDVRRISIAKNHQTLAIVTQAIGALRQAGIEVCVLLMPMKARIYADMLPPDFQPNADFVGSYATARRELLAIQALVPDLASFLAAQRQSHPEAMFLKTDTHWTPFAAELAAAEVARQLLAHLPPAPGQHGMVLGKFETRVQQGDLMLHLPPEQQKLYPAESFNIRSVSAAAGANFNGGDLLDEARPDVAVVGNSYMLPYLGFPFALSNQLARPINLSWQTARIGPYRTLLDYLRSDSFKAARPRQLVWQLPEGTLDITPEPAQAWGESAMPVKAFIDGVVKAIAKS